MRCILRTSQFKQVVIKKVINIRCRGNCVLLLLSPELGTQPDRQGWLLARHFEPSLTGGLMPR